MSNNRLTFELVPSTCWWSNVRSQVTAKQWEICKTFVKERSNRTCEICGGVGRNWPVECHERWEYDDDNQVQTLVGLIALCPNCHAAKHIGRTLEVGPQKRISEVKWHVRFTNHWGADHLEFAIANAFAIWSIRSEWEWDLDVSWLASIGVELPKYVWKKEERSASRADH